MSGGSTDDASGMPPPASPPPHAACATLGLNAAQCAALLQSLALQTSSPPPPVISPPPLPPPPDPSLIQSSLDLIIPIAAGVGGILVVLLITLILFFVCCRRRAKSLMQEVMQFLFPREKVSEFLGYSERSDMMPADEEYGAQGPSPAAISSTKGDQQDDDPDDDRKRLRARIAGFTADERERNAQRAALEGAETHETAEAAEAAVAAAGSPEGALLAAVSRSASPGEVRALLRRGANPDAAFLDRGALAVAARSCALGVVKVLIDAGATLDMKDGRGWTPLMHAIDAHSPNHSREGVLILLLDAGAAVNVWGNDLEGPLEMLEKREKEHALAAQQAASGYDRGQAHPPRMGGSGSAPPLLPLHGYGSKPGGTCVLPSLGSAVSAGGTSISGNSIEDGIDEEMVAPSPSGDVLNLMRQKSGRLDFDVKTSPELPPTN